MIHEFVEVWRATLYFGICFSVVLFLKQLVLEQVHIAYSGWGKAWISALVVAKVLIVLNNTSWGRRLQHKAVLWDVSYRSFIYSLVAAIVLVLEKLWEVHGEYPDLRSAMIGLYEARDIARIQGTVLCLFVTFFGYNLYGDLSRYLGRDRLRRFLLDAKETAPDKGPLADPKADGSTEASTP